MDSSLLIAADATIITGLLGYVIAMLWLRPNLSYYITKRKLDHIITRELAKINEIRAQKPGNEKTR